MTTQVLTRTPSGMAVAYGTVPQEVAEYVACFTDDNLNAYRAYRTAAMEAHGKLATATSLDPLGEHIAKL
ncbi:hypothetical protein CCC_00372 [Paramagnetospirillum magnetotacticum MS-1]|uniref:Uncharacterized protein n=1 Tax=Paramagnetospirillum magnetotacticum MS-1 TaxID=272627 RepID=A0A0C2UWW2_PARME|nr:hypothetical protein CCC_00372 [Paramagnetospirillum magnetotacticum MS-1]